MMRRVIWPMIFIWICLTVLTGCYILFSSLPSASALPLSGTGDEPVSPVPQAESADIFTAILYFRFMQQDLLAQENRKLALSMDVSLEIALVTALLEGPSASSPELRKLFSGQVEVVSALKQGPTIIITLSENVLFEPMENRNLQMQSLAATLIENIGYESVQVLVDRKSTPTTSLRLSNSFFDPETDGPAPSLTRRDEYILSPERTASALLDAWLQKDYETLYQYIAIQDTRTFNARPAYQTAIEEMDGGYSLIDYGLGCASVSQDGMRAVMNGELKLLQGNRDERVLTRYPIMLIRENGIWKMAYQDFLLMVYR